MGKVWAVPQPLWRLTSTTVPVTIKGGLLRTTARKSVVSPSQLSVLSTELIVNKRWAVFTPDISRLDTHAALLHDLLIEPDFLRSDSLQRKCLAVRSIYYFNAILTQLSLIWRHTWLRAGAIAAVSPLLGYGRKSQYEWPLWLFWEDYISETECPMDERSFECHRPFKPTLIPSDACHGMWHVPSERVSETHYPGLGHNAWVDCIQIWCVLRDHQASYYLYKSQRYGDLHVRTCTPLFHISGTAGRIVLKFGAWQIPINLELRTCQKKGVFARAHVPPLRALNTGYSKVFLVY